MVLREAQVSFSETNGLPVTLVVVFSDSTVAVQALAVGAP